MKKVALFILLFTVTMAAPSVVVAEEGKRCEKSYSKHTMKHHKKGYLFYGAISKLELSPKQKTELAKLKLGYKKEKIKAESRIKILEVELKELLLKEPLDLDSIRAKLEHIEKEKAELRFARYRALKELMSILTPKQRKEFREKLLYGLYR